MITDPDAVRIGASVTGYDVIEEELNGRTTEEFSSPTPRRPPARATTDPTSAWTHVALGELIASTIRATL